MFRKKKTPKELVSLTKVAVGAKDGESLGKQLAQMKEILYGVEDKLPVEAKCVELAQNIRQTGLMPILIENLSTLPFESRKDVAQMFNNLVRRNHDGFADYVANNTYMVDMMIGAYQNPSTALLCGSMLRECIRYESIAQKVLNDQSLWLFFDDYVHLPNFDVASDAFVTLGDLLTRHKLIVFDFLSLKFDEVFSHYNKLLTSTNFVTRRQGLKVVRVPFGRGVGIH